MTVFRWVSDECRNTIGSLSQRPFWWSANHFSRPVATKILVPYHTIHFAKTMHKGESDIVLELVGRKADTPVAVKKVDGGGRHGVKLVVELPTIVGAEEANLAAAMLLDELDRLPPETFVVAVSLSSIQLKPGGADGLRAILSSQAAGVQRVSLHNVVPPDMDEESLRNFNLVGTAFASAPLRTLSVSKNAFVGASFWNVWKGATKVEQIILDEVTLDTSAWKELASTFCWEKVEELQVVLNEGPDSEAAVEAVNSILRQCTRLLSLRWIQQSGGESPLPIQGFREMTNNMLKVNARGGSIRHLVLGGGFDSETSSQGALPGRDLNDLFAILQDMPRLRTLKLRSLGLSEVESLMDTLQDARPPLEMLDLSHNALDHVEPLMELVHIPKLNKELKFLILSHNKVGTNEGRDLLVHFRDYPIELDLDRNDINLSALVRGFQDDVHDLERERDRWRNKAEHGGSDSGGLDRSNRSNTNTLSAETAILRAQNKHLREERDAMMKAFSIVGTRGQVEEQTKLMERVKRLEDMVRLGATFKKTSDRGVERSNSLTQRAVDRRSGLRVLAGDLPTQLDRLTPARSMSSRSPGPGHLECFRSSSSTSLTSVESLENCSQFENVGGSTRLIGSGPGQLQRFRSVSSRCLTSSRSGDSSLDQLRNSQRSMGRGSLHQRRSVSSQCIG